eukprot:3033709-Prymnesium_polylepis.1
MMKDACQVRDLVPFEGSSVLPGFERSAWLRLRSCAGGGSPRASTTSAAPQATHRASSARPTAASATTRFASRSDP